MNAPRPDKTILPWISVQDDKPREYGKYLVCRLGAGKIHFETWNTTGWAYNNNDITHWIPEIAFPLETLPNGEQKK